MSETTMVCAFCNEQKPWTAEHFPVRIYAECATCIAQREESGAPNRIRRLISRVFGRAGKESDAPQ